MATHRCRRQLTAGVAGGIVCLWLATFAAAARSADKTDTVEFGQSRMVGEVKHLDRGKLYFNTDATGTIEVDWLEIRVLVTSQYLRIEHRDGRISFGSLGAGREPSRLTVVDGSQREDLPLTDIVAFEPIESGFWDRLNIDTAMGYSFAKATEVEQLDLSARFEHDTETHSRALTLSAQSSESEGGDRATRRNADYLSLRLNRAPYLWGWMADYEDNDALGLDFRMLGAAVAGRDFFPRANRRLRALAGFAVSQQQFAGGDEEIGVELLVGGFVDWYQFRSPELDLSSSLILYPSLSETGRWRSRFDISLRWELYDDLFWNLTFYDDYDSDGVADDETAGSSNDFGVSTGLGWSW